MAQHSLQKNEKPGKIIIKKYSNRRLYDVTHSQYLTLDEVVTLIQEGHEIQVLDSKTKEDLTQSVLTQIFLDKSGSHLFSTSFLHQMIRNRDGILGEFFTDFVPKFMESYMEMRDTMKRQISTITSPRTWLPVSKKDLKMFTNAFQSDGDEKAKSKVPELPDKPLLEEMPELPPLQFDGEPPPPDDDEPDPKEVDLLREKIRELEDRVNRLGTKN